MIKKLLDFSILSLCILSFFLTSCSSTRSTMNSQDTKLSELQREDYEVLEQVEGKAQSTKVWFLFIPFGGKKDKKLENKAYNRATTKVEEADGLLNARYEHKKLVIPLIVVTPVIKRVKVVGRAYKLKTDQELKQN